MLNATPKIPLCQNQSLGPQASGFGFSFLIVFPDVRNFFFAEGWTRLDTLGQAWTGLDKWTGIDTDRLHNFGVGGCRWASERVLSFVVVRTRLQKRPLSSNGGEGERKRRISRNSHVAIFVFKERVKMCASAGRIGSEEVGFRDWTRLEAIGRNFLDVQRCATLCKGVKGMHERLKAEV